MLTMPLLPTHLALHELGHNGVGHHRLEARVHPVGAMGGWVDGLVYVCIHT